MSKAKLGDYIRVTTDDYFAAKKGAVGKVLEEDSNPFVKWYTGIRPGATMTTYRGESDVAAINVEKFELITEEEFNMAINKHYPTLVIRTDGKVTTAQLKEGHKVIREAKASCSPEDTFSFKRGADIAYDRLFQPDERFYAVYTRGEHQMLYVSRYGNEYTAYVEGEETEIPESDFIRVKERRYVATNKGFNGTVLPVGDVYAATKGVLYEVINGCILNDCGNLMRIHPVSDTWIIVEDYSKTQDISF